MKKLLLSFCFISSVAFAQDSKFLVGINTASVWNSYLFRDHDAFLFDSRINLNVGIQSKYFLNKKFWIDAQLNYATKNFGSGIDFSYFVYVDPNDPAVSQGNSRYNVRQNYFEIPISLNYSFTSEKPVNFFCSLGFTNSFLLSARATTSYNGSSDVGERYKSYLMSIRPGLGILFPMGKGFYGSAECYGNIYPENVYNESSFIKGNPFQLALGFSVLKKLGKA